jgi:hypothetical protein
LLSTCLLLTLAPALASAQSAWTSADQESGRRVPQSDQLRLGVDFMAGYGNDSANRALGFEKQGRIGYVVFTANGKVGRRLSYTLAINPVNETQPLPGCGEATFFYPNVPTMLYGSDTTISCDSKFGSRRVDAYRGIALDVVPQQGPIREAYLDAQVTSRLRVRFGRMRLPIGFAWDESGAFTAKDTPKIQRINAQASFGTMFSYIQPAANRTRPLFSLHAAATLGDSNRWFDYDYIYFEDGAFETNSDVTALVAGSVSPLPWIELRASYQYGATGSKVERRPSYWASKRNDQMTMVGIAIQPVKQVRLIAERAEYVWGPTPTSAEMLGLDPRAIHKNGSYFTAEVVQPVRASLAVGASLSVERVDRNDSLVKFMVSRGDMNVTPYASDRMSVVRAFVDVNAELRLGVYYTREENPFPWLSGITPVEGDRAFSSANTNKWGFITRISVR